MEVKRFYKTRMTLNEFADQHGLTLEIRERSGEFSNSTSRFYAQFNGIEVKSGQSILCGVYGNGRTEHEAVANYVQVISEKPLVYGAHTCARKEINAPIIEGFTL